MGNIEEEHLTLKQIEVGGDQPVAGTTGRWAYFHAETNVKLGGWYNAAKAQLHFGSAGTGEITGMASAFNAELYLPNKHCAGGVYTALEVNLDFQASTTFAYSAAYPRSMMSLKANGTAAKIVSWGDGAGSCVFAISGVVSKAGAVIDQTQGPGAANASFKVNLNGTDYWVMCSSTAN